MFLERDLELILLQAKSWGVIMSVFGIRFELNRSSQSGHRISQDRVLDDLVPDFADGVHDGRVVAPEELSDLRQRVVGEVADEILRDLPG